MLYTITARDVLCDERGKLHKQPVHWATTLNHHNLLWVAGRYLTSEHGRGVFSVGSASGADYVAVDVLEAYFIVGKPGGNMFDSLRFESRYPAEPYINVGDRSRIRWTIPEQRDLMDAPLEVLDVRTAWPYIWVALDSEPYPRQVRFSHVARLGDPRC